MSSRDHSGERESDQWRTPAKAGSPRAELLDAKDLRGLAASRIDSGYGRGSPGLRTKSSASNAQKHIRRPRLLSRLTRLLVPAEHFLGIDNIQTDGLVQKLPRAATDIPKRAPYDAHWDQATTTAHLRCFLRA